MSRSQTANRLAAAIKAELAAVADPVRAKSQQAYLKSRLPCHGVANPTVRLIVRTALAHETELNRVEWVETIEKIWQQASHREERLAAIEMAAAKRTWAGPDLLGIYRHMTVSGAWWDLVDAISSPLVAEIITRFPEEKATMRAWAGSEDLWLRRVGIICQRTFGARTDVKLLGDAIETNLLDSRFGTEFFIRKAIGWALRAYSKTDPDWVREFVARHDDELSALSKREALKIIQPS